MQDYERFIKQQELYDDSYNALDERYICESPCVVDGEVSASCSSTTHSPILGEPNLITGFRATIIDSDDTTSNSGDSSKTITSKWKRFDLGIVRNFRRWINKGYVVDTGEDVPNLCGLDCPVELPVSHADVIMKLEDIPRVAGTYAAIARCELNIIDKDTATVLVVRQFLSRTMKARDMRIVDINKVLPYAVQLSFLPTKYEVLARNMTLMRSYQERLEEAQPKYTRSRPWLFNWLGTKVYEPVVKPN
jgi:hypothetical protein